MNKQAIRSLLFLLGWSSVIFFTIAAVGQQTGRSLPALSTWIDEDNDARPDPAEPSATATQTLVAEWRDGCVSQRMEISGIGMGDQHNTLNPQTLPLSSSTSVSWLLAQVAGRLGDSSPLPDSVTFTTDAPASITLNEPTRSNQYGYSFETAIGQATSQITVSVDNIGGDFKTPRGLILYARQDTENELWTSIGKTTNDFVYWDSNGTHTEVFTFTALAEPVDLSITAAVIDNNVDERPLVLEARAGGKLATSGPINEPTDGPLLNIIELTLTQAPTGTEQISVTLKSPPGNGDSLVLVGLNVSYPCPEVGADLEITETVGLAAVNESELITYTVTVTNNGPSDATSVWVTDTLPTGLIFGGYTATKGIYTGATGLWEVGDLANKATATLMITATVNSCSGGPIITNTAVVTAESDSNPDNNEATVSVTSTVAMYCIYLPIIYRDYEESICNPYDFNISPSGWPVDSEGQVRTGYTTNFEEYFIERYIPGMRIVQAPVDYSNKYTIEVDIRWNDVGYEHGIIFGQLGDANSLTHRFGVDLTNRSYRSRHGSINSGWWECSDSSLNNPCWIKFDSNTVVYSGTNSNHLRVECDGATFKLYINPDQNLQALSQISDTSCRGRVGVFAQSIPEDSYASAFFDNFTVKCSSSSLNTFDSFENSYPVFTNFAEAVYDK